MPTPPNYRDGICCDTCDFQGVDYKKFSGSVKAFNVCSKYGMAISRWHVCDSHPALKKEDESDTK